MLSSKAGNGGSDASLALEEAVVAEWMKSQALIEKAFDLKGVVLVVVEEVVRERVEECC